MLSFARAHHSWVRSNFNPSHPFSPLPSSTSHFALRTSSFAPRARGLISSLEVFPRFAKVSYQAGLDGTGWECQWAARAVGFLAARDRPMPRSCVPGLVPRTETVSAECVAMPVSAWGGNARRVRPDSTSESGGWQAARSRRGGNDRYAKRKARGPQLCHGEGHVCVVPTSLRRKTGLTPCDR